MSIISKNPIKLSKKKSNFNKFCSDNQFYSIKKLLAFKLPFFLFFNENFLEITYL